MMMLTQLDTMVTEYAELAIALRQKTSAVAAVMGNREDIRHPAHKSFYENVQVWTDTFAQTCPDQQKLIEALKILLLSAAEYENTAACWYLIAIQEHGKVLIPLLDERSKKELADAYCSAFPANRQLPLQKEVSKMLGIKKKRWFAFL